MYMSHLRRFLALGRNNVDLNDVRTNVDLDDVRTNVDLDDVCTNVVF